MANGLDRRGAIIGVILLGTIAVIGVALLTVKANYKRPDQEHIVVNILYPPPPPPPSKPAQP